MARTQGPQQSARAAGRVGNAAHILVMAVLPFNEWRPDVSDLRKNYTRLLRNVLPRSDGYGPFKDVETFTGALPAACRGYFVARKADGTALLFAGTSDRLYLLDNTTLSWGDVSDSGS